MTLFYSQNGLGSKRIPKEQVVKTERVISINDQYTDEDQKFVKTVVQREIDASIRRIREKEKIVFEEIEKKKETIYQQFKEEAKEEAIQEALLQLKHQFEEKENELRQLLDTINQEKIGFYQYIEENLAEMVKKNQEIIYRLATDMVEEIFENEVKIDEEKMEVYLKNTILSFPKKTKIVSVRVHPSIISYIRDQFENGYMDQIVLFGDLELALTDVVIETEEQFVDVGLKTKLEQIKKWVAKIGVEE